MRNINDITTKEEAHCFLTEKFANIAHLLTSKKPGLSKKIDSYMIDKDILQKKYKIDVDSYTNAIKAVLEMKSRWQDQEIPKYKKEKKELREKVLDEKYGR